MQLQRSRITMMISTCMFRFGYFKDSFPLNRCFCFFSLFLLKDIDYKLPLLHYTFLHCPYTALISRLDYCR